MQLFRQHSHPETVTSVPVTRKLIAGGLRHLEFRWDEPLPLEETVCHCSSVMLHSRPKSFKYRIWKRAKASDFGADAVG